MHLLTNCECLLSISTSVSAMIAWMAGVDRIILHTQDIENNAVWSGIPDSCVLPAARFKAMWDNGSSSIFLKPNSGETIDWKFPAYFSGSIEKDRKMYKVSNITKEKIKQAIEEYLSCGDYEEGIASGNICNSCKLNTDMNICAYVHEKPEVYNL